MTKPGRRALDVALAGAAGLGLLLFNDVSPSTFGFAVTRAHAVIGRPMTPMSYAGVARRTTRRDVYGGGAYGGYRGGYGATAIGAAAVGAAAYGSATYGAGNCVQVTDVYGRLVTQCY